MNIVEAGTLKRYEGQAQNELTISLVNMAKFLKQKLPSAALRFVVFGFAQNTREIVSLLCTQKVLFFYYWQSICA